MDCMSSSTGAGFDNWLDAVDGSFCTFEGGDDPTQVFLNSLIKCMKKPDGCEYRMVSTLIRLAGSKVCK
jgi:hypothetical protein